LHVAVGAVDYVCLLSESGDERPVTGRARRVTATAEGWASQGQGALMLHELGFDTSRMQPGQGLDERGHVLTLMCASKDAIQALQGGAA